MADGGDLQAGLAARLRARHLVPYLGPGLLDEGGAVPRTPEALAEFLGSRVALPRRARGNPWAAAQFIEGRRHRKTLVALMAEAFAAPPPPSALEVALAALRPPLIVDTWYAGTMRAALAADPGAQDSWGEIQGVPRSGLGGDIWYRAYDSSGAEVPVAAAAEWRTLLYTPHGGVAPARNFLVADSDYVEVLTEIDIQTPIPDEVKRRREGRGFLFLGCRFHDQMLRTYARQIAKRSGGPHVAILEHEGLTRNERRFLAELGVLLSPVGLAGLAAVIGDAELAA